jgi:homocysteine S-methyltransferase
MGYVEVGLTAGRADAALLRSVELARSVVSEFPERRVLVAGSLGPYGAALHNGGEYHGNYDCSTPIWFAFTASALRFSRRRAANRSRFAGFRNFPVARRSARGGRGAGLVAGAASVVQLLVPRRGHVSHGEPVADCAALVASFPQTVAIGVNCVPPKWIPALIAELQDGFGQADCGISEFRRGMGRKSRCWTGVSDPEDFGARAPNGSRQERRSWAAAAARGPRTFARWLRRSILPCLETVTPARAPLCLCGAQ